VFYIEEACRRCISEKITTKKRKPDPLTSKEFFVVDGGSKKKTGGRGKNDGKGGQT